MSVPKVQGLRLSWCYGSGFAVIPACALRKLARIGEMQRFRFIFVDCLVMDYAL